MQLMSHSISVGLKPPTDACLYRVMLVGLSFFPFNNVGKILIHHPHTNIYNNNNNNNSNSNSNSNVNDTAITIMIIIIVIELLRIITIISTIIMSQ